jgi:hypothetical protein
VLNPEQGTTADGSVRTASKNLLDFIINTLEYNPVTGDIIKEGKPVGSVNSSGYLVTKVNGITMQCHRIAWALFYREFPVGPLDHINRNRIDNSINNLRISTPSENTKNQSIYSNNRSGFTGVSFHKKTQKWRAYISVDGSPFHIGLFDTALDAAEARVLEQMEHGYFQGHGGYYGSAA